VVDKMELNSKMVMEEKMAENRRMGLFIGVLYIIGTISGIMSVELIGLIPDSNAYFFHIASKSNQYLLGALFILCKGFSLAFIHIIIYPILKIHNKTLALGYVVFRGALETITYIATFLCMLMLLDIGKNYITEILDKSIALGDIGKRHITEIEIKGILIVKFDEFCSLARVYIFGIGALMLYSGLYKSQLVPSWLSLWGADSTGKCNTPVFGKNLGRSLVTQTLHRR
jgi:hypothetical protein